MENPPTASTVCSECQAPLGADGRCLACLLRGGLPEETLAASSPIGPTNVSDATVYGDFEIARREDGTLWELGRGAMGVTYRAVDRVLHRTVALKVFQLGAMTLAGDRRLDEALRERFLREARAAAALRHAHIAGVFQFGALHDTGRCYYAMELVEGETLEARVRRDGPLDLETALEVASQVAAALVAAAARGLIHRDLKPSNLMLESGGPALEVKVIDFGLAKATAATAGEADLTHGGFVGTPAYASPEQFEGGAVDARSDVYSLGVTLWYALTGRVPFRGRTFDELRDLLARADPPVEQLREKKVPLPVIALLRSMLAVDPAERPASAKALLAALETCRRPGTERGGEPSSPGEWNPAPRAWRMAAVLAVVAILAAAGVWWAWSRQPVAGRAGAVPPVVDKSIAVLPFDNRSADRDDAFFTDGVQDEILTDLSKVADLKVISRTSVLPYRSGTPRNLREISRELGVAHVVEGSVQRSGNRVRVTAQLINGRTDAHEWAEHYDRDLADVFAIQSEIAQAIAAQLRAKLSPVEKAAIDTRPTGNLAAYELYLRGRENENRFYAKQPDLDAAQRFYQQAVDLDPTFALAHASLSGMVSFNEGSRGEHKARAEADLALRLQPELGEGHLALAYYFSRSGPDYERAFQELALAAVLLPNSSEVARAKGRILRNQGKWREALEAFERAARLDPDNPQLLHYDLALSYRAVRDWPAALRARRRLGVVLDKLNVSNAPSDIGRALDEFYATRSLVPLQNVVNLMGADPNADVRHLNFTRYQVLLAERKYPEAEQALALVPPDFTTLIEHPTKTVLQAVIQIARHDDPNLIAATLAPDLQSARQMVEQHPNAFDNHSSLGVLLAFVGKKDEAIRDGRRGVELAPSHLKDFASSALALIYAHSDAGDEACNLLETLLTRPGLVDLLVTGSFPSITLTDLRYSVQWDPLRDNPRFQKLIAGPEPVTVY